MADNGLMDKEGFDPDSRLRASDADRDSAAAVINGAMAEGRLTAAEHSERLDAIYTARTHAELAPILDDLPARAATGVTAAGVTAAGVTAAGPAQAPARQRGGRIAAVLSSASRSGRWRPEPSTAVVTVFGSADLDFREAVLPGREIALRAVAVLGSVSVIVPPEMRVVDSGLAIMGTRDIAADGAESERPDAPVLRLSGLSVLGSLDVQRKPRNVIADRPAALDQ